jgi:X-X-X-Leu-X-X-Gly heptad repeat protein
MRKLIVLAVLALILTGLCAEVFADPLCTHVNNLSTSIGQLTDGVKKLSEMKKVVQQKKG